MTAALAITPASGSITAKTTVCRVDVTGANPNLTQDITGTKSGETSVLASHIFRPSSDGKHSWFSIMFPSAGAWTLTLADTNDNSLATLAVTVA